MLVGVHCAHLMLRTAHCSVVMGSEHVQISINWLHAPSVGTPTLHLQRPRLDLSSTACIVTCCSKQTAACQQEAPPQCQTAPLSQSDAFCTVLQEFGEEGHLVHSGMLRSAQYLFDRLQGLVEVRRPAALCLYSPQHPVDGPEMPHRGRLRWALPVLGLACSCSCGAGTSDAGRSCRAGVSACSRDCCEWLRKGMHDLLLQAGA